MKEKASKQMLIMVQPSLYEAFEETCNSEYKSVSEVVRDLMLRHSKGWVQVPSKE